MRRTSITGLSASGAFTSASTRPRAAFALRLALAGGAFALARGSLALAGGALPLALAGDGLALSGDAFALAGGAFALVFDAGAGLPARGALRLVAAICAILQRPAQVHRIAACVSSSSRVTTRGR